MKLIVITTPSFFIEEDKILTTLFEEGLDYLHIRKPDTAPMFSERLLTLIPEQYRRRIVTHDHFYLKEEFNLMGIHLNDRNPEIPENYRGHVSCSCHSIEEVKRKKASCNYVFMSPVFDSISRQEYLSTYSAEDIRKAAKAGVIDKKVIALGGITDENLPLIKDYGFGGAAIMGDLWDRFDAHNNMDYKELINHFRVLKRLAD